jgi:hypothetical protein
MGTEKLEIRKEMRKFAALKNDEMLPKESVHLSGIRCG